MKLREISFVLCLALSACTGKSINVTPISGFETDRYLGTWYEVARLDHSFERGLTNVTATYSMRDDGMIRVQNRGYDAEKAAYKTAQGKAKFAQDKKTGHLKVSFFGPFYGDYIIFDLDETYSTASISGGKDSYLWLLSRTPKVSDVQRREFIAQSKALGYAADNLIWVSQERAQTPWAK